MPAAAESTRVPATGTSPRGLRGGALGFASLASVGVAAAGPAGSLAAPFATRARS